MKKMGKSKPVFEETTESDVTTEEELETRNDRRKSNSRYRSRSTKRSRGTPSGLTPNAKEARFDAEPRFNAKFDADGVIIEPSAEREAANRRARIDKEKRYIAQARPHKARSGGGGGGDLDNDWQQNRGRSTGRGKRSEGNSRSTREDKIGKKSLNTNSKTNSGATNESAAARGSNTPGDTTAPNSNVAQDESKITRPMARNSESIGQVPSAPDKRDKSLNNQLTNYFSDTPPQPQTTKNPNFSAMMARARARAEEVVYVFSGQDDQLPLTQTQFELIVININDQALTLQIEGEPAPEFKFQQYSRANDKGFIGVDSPEAADLVVQAIARITIKGVKFRGWRSEEMKAKHLVTVEISEFLAKCGVEKIVKAMIKRNELKGGCHQAWVEPHPTIPRLRVFKFFADDTLHRELLLRRNGPLGEDQGWNIMLWVGTQHSKAHISQPLSTIQTTAVEEADQLKADRELARIAEETDNLLTIAKAKATTTATTTVITNPTASTSTSPTNQADTGPTVKAKINAYLEERGALRAAALAAEEEAAEAERLMDETDNADTTLTSNWADGGPPSPPAPPPAS
jgi:hypothetical protein